MRKMLFKKKCPGVFYPLFVCAALLMMGCKQKTANTPDYNLQYPEVTPLGNVMTEISGINYYNQTGDSALLAVVDSKQQVFKLEMAVPRLKDHTEKVIPANGDPEDIVKVDSAIFVLLSRGVIEEIPDQAQNEADIKMYPLPLSGTNDFETLYYDPTVKSLILLCKACDHEKKGGIRTAFRFDLVTRTYDTTEFYTISKDDVKATLKDANAKFDPSAAAFHPINKRLYILSSAGNLLVITDGRSRVMDAFYLSPDDFPQAEGIAFAPNGDMFISNEKKYSGSKPTLLRFRYRNGEKKK
jgi:uncharacterized protein YjiK